MSARIPQLARQTVLTEKTYLLMSLAELTSRAAVHEAIKEFDRLGRQQFLLNYGFRKSRAYFLDHDGKLYDSKPIVGAAYGHQHKQRGPLRWSDFSGGESTVRRKLEELGFNVRIGG